MNSIRLQLGKPNQPMSDKPKATTKVSTTKNDVTEFAADAVVVGLYDDGSLSPEAERVDKASGGELTRLVENKDLSGKSGKATLLLWPKGIKAERLVVTGLGPQDGFGRGAAFKAAGAAAMTLSSRQLGKVGFFLLEGAAAEVVAAGVAGSLAGCQGQDLYRAEKSRYPLGEVVWAADAAAVEEGQILGEGINLTRWLVNEPSSEIYPATFAEAAEKMAADYGLKCEVWDEKKLAEEKCGSLLGVARASVKPPRLVIWRYEGGKPGDPLLALVGKGVTFDSGGLSLKPSDSMKTMKCDMAGAASVAGAMQTIARLKLPINVVGLVGLVENMISGDSYRLGDVLTARSGKTIEVHNTDAEGRLVLADVLNVAVEQKPAAIIDLATLTGACMVALGTDVAGLMTNNQPWCDQVSAAAATCGEPVWQLPMFPEYGEQIKSDVADIKNVGEGRWGGAITAAKLLEEFVEGTPWTHIDIAGPAFYDRPKSWQDAGGSGALVRTLVEVAREWKGIG